MRINPQGGFSAVGPPPHTDGQARFRNTGGTENLRIVSPIAGTATTITDLTAGATYRFAVRAYDTAGNGSPWSTEITVTTSVNPVPSTVAAGTAIPTPTIPVPAITPATVTAVAGIPGPAVGRIRTATVGPVTTGQVTGLTTTSNYTARVRARDAAGNWSDWSAPYPFTTTGSGVATPTTVAAVAGIPAPVTGGTPPTVTPGLSRPVVRGGTVGLDVNATPPGGQAIIAYNWQIISGAGSLTNATTATPTYTAPGSGAGTAVVRATVSATNGGQASADLTVSYHATIIAAENALSGTARATWDLTSPNLGGIDTLQGFADGFTANRDTTVNFKIAQSDTAGWSAAVYRLGWYGGDGARAYGTITPSGGQVTASQAQPAPGDADPVTTRLSADAGNWSTTLTWTPPAWAPTGMYVLRLNRTGGGASHVMFILRDDARRTDLTFMPADSTWNAYNAWGGMGSSGQYGGNSLYYGINVDQYHADCARYVSYNRPVVNRGAADVGRDYGAVEWSNFFTSEYPMLRFIERCGYDVKYYGCIDAAGDPTGTHLTGNGTTRAGTGAAIFVGHNEYWSDAMRSGWETAKAAGLSVFSCAGNEVFWRLVGADNDGSSRPRTWECYKSTIGSRGSTGRTQWTGTWRDPDGAGKGGGQPENTFTGTIFVTNGPDLRSLVVPFNGGYSGQPLWRHTSVAALTTGQSYTSGSQILGFEWDTYGPSGIDTTAASYLGAPHPSARYCSNVTYAVSASVLTDAGDEYGNGNVTHRLVVQPSAAAGQGITFGTGTCNWAFGVDDANTYQQGTNNVDTVLQQATVNVFTDMGATAATLPSPLITPTFVDWFATPGTVTAVTAIPAPIPITPSSVAPATVAATTQIGLGTGRLFVQDFEQGSAGTTITTANSAGGTSTAFTNVYTGGGQTIVRYSTMSYRGALSGQFYTALTADAAYADRLIGSASNVPVYARMRMQASGMPDAAGAPFARFIDSSGNTQAEARLTSTGALALYSGAGNLIGTTSATISGMQWADVGLSVKAFSASAGVIELVLYNASGVITETFTSSANLNTLRSGGGNALRVGQLRTDAMLYSIFLDDIALSTATYPMLPTATSTWAQPMTVAATTAVPGPTAQAAAVATPATVAGIAAVPGPAVRLSTTATPGVVAAVAAVPAATAQTSSGILIGPPTVAAVAAVPARTPDTGSITGPATVAAAAAIPGPSVQSGSSTTAAPGTVQTAAAVTTPTISAGAGPAPAVVAATTSIPAPAVQTSSGTTAAPATILAGAAVATPTVIATNSPVPGTVVAVAAVPAPAPAVGTRPAPAVVVAATAIPGPTVAGTAVPTPATVVAVAAIPAASTRIYAAVTVATLTAVASIGSIRHIVGQVITSTGTASITGDTTTNTIIGDALTARIIDDLPGSP